MRGTAYAVAAVLFMGMSNKVADRRAFQKPNPNKPVVEAVAVVDKVAEGNAVVDGQIEALLRAWRITDACYDERSKVYLVNIASHKHEEGMADQGWKMIDKYEFVKLQNGTYVIKSTGYMYEVFPNTTGLRCKQQAYVWQ